MGLYTMTWSIAAVAGPAIGTWIYERDKATVWHLSLAMAVIVLIGFYVFERCLRKSKGPNGHQHSKEQQELS